MKSTSAQRIGRIYHVDNEERKEDKSWTRVGERYARAGRERESGRAKNSLRIRPSKWAGECKSIPQRGARNCAPTLECGNPFSRALLHVLVKRRYRHQHTAYECPPRVRHCNGATVQRRNETDIAAERALSRPTCPTRPGEPPLPARSSSGNNVSPTLPVTRLRSLADPRWRTAGVFYRISETMQYMPDSRWQSPDGPFTRRHLNTHRISSR